MIDSIRTDLAMEARELHPELSGVTEEKEENGGISVSRIEIKEKSAAEALGKKLGKYITIDAPALSDRLPETFTRTAEALANELSRLIEGVDGDALVIGLGNRAVTPDSLGPRVADKLFVTRHIKRHLPDALPKGARSVSVFAPGVLGTTGIETADAVLALCEKLKPALIIAIDSLASRRAERISATVQLSDTGISPGSGIGNIRSGISRDTAHIPVIAVGVPLVVYASTIISDAINGEAQGADSLESVEYLAVSTVAERFRDMIVTPKEIDSIVSDMASIVADGINRALFGPDYPDVKELTA